MNTKQILIDYLKMKVEEEDWHGVSDAANDIRVLQAQSICVSACEDYVAQTQLKTPPVEVKKRHTNPNSAHGRGGPNFKLNLKIANEIRELDKAGWSQPELAKKYGVRQQTISAIVNNKTYAV